MATKLEEVQALGFESVEEARAHEAQLQKRRAAQVRCAAYQASEAAKQRRMRAGVSADAFVEPPVILTGAVFCDAPAPLGALWAELSELEDQLAERLVMLGEGTIVSHGATGWKLAAAGDQVQLVAGHLKAGELVDPQSRFDFDLSWVDIEEEEIELQIAAVTALIAEMVAGDGGR